ncbi:uncharacterized protein LOC142166439 [Nicotiana tabacum]|uniref:Uncharacterized protein LOC142166439 n=1 Tax=Nicotiana tabacum TaxID=4097 RepID=A0AC58SA21_TOBAC
MGKLFMNMIEECCKGTNTKTPTIRDAEPGEELQNWIASPSLVRRESCNQIDKRPCSAIMKCNKTSKSNNPEYKEYDESMMPDNLPQEIEQLESQKKPNLEEIEVVNLGSEEDVIETRIIIHLGAKQKEKMIELLRHEFDIVDITQKAIKGQALADHLTENPVDGGYEPLTTYFSEEEVLFVGEDIAESYPGWRMFFDGAANFKGVGIGAILISESEQHYPASAKIRFPCTNNISEYEACILGISIAVDIDIKELLVIGNTDLLIHQVHGEWSTKNVKILSYLHYMKELCKKFTKIEFKHVPIIHNEFVDALATLSSMIQHPDKNNIDPIEVGIKYQHAYYFRVNEEPDGKSWYHNIKKLLTTQEYPENATNGQKRPLRSLSPTGGMDVIGPTEPAASNGHRFILVAIDYFTKWVKESTYKAVTKKVVEDFVQNNIVCRFGIPESIITNNAANLNSDLMIEISEKFRIIHRNSTAYRPQMNGAVEVANNNIKRILRMMVDNHTQWYEKLPFALLGYRTTMRTSIGETPYMLVYSTEAIIPAEVEIPSLKVIQEAKLDDAEWIRVRKEQLMLIYEKRMDAICHG